MFGNRQWIAGGIALLAALALALVAVLFVQLRADVDQLQTDVKASSSDSTASLERAEAQLGQLEHRLDCVLNLFSDIYDEGDPPAPGEAAARLSDCPEAR
jgi:hypothetical protein